MSVDLLDKKPDKPQCIYSFESLNCQCNYRLFTAYQKTSNFMGMGSHQAGCHVIKQKIVLELAPILLTINSFPQVELLK